MTQEIITREESTDLVDAELFSPASIFDIERFEQVMRVASVMARNTTLPDHLRSKASNPDVAYEETRGNCFMICNQAANWGMDPFAVAQATSFLYGKLVLEGKLVRAVIDRKLGFSLHYTYFGATGDMKRRVYVSDKPLVDAKGNALTEDQIKALKENHASGFKITDGTLQKWHTKNKSGGVNDNWVKDEDKMFRERGAREWCREHKPGLMLGVYTPDEFDEVEHTTRSNRARDITYNPLLENNSQQPMDRVDTTTGEILDAETVSSGAADAARAVEEGSGAGSDKANVAAPTNSSQASSPRPVDDKAAEPGTPPTGSAAAKFVFTADEAKKYASWLGRQGDADKMPKASEHFFSENGRTPEKGSAEHRLFGSIYLRNLERASGKIDGVGLLDEIHEEIDTIYGMNDFPGDK